MSHRLEIAGSILQESGWDFNRSFPETKNTGQVKTFTRIFRFFLKSKEKLIAKTSGQ
jgi:hypothetical protein